MVSINNFDIIKLDTTFVMQILTYENDNLLCAIDQQNEVIFFEVIDKK